MVNNGDIGRQGKITISHRGCFIDRGGANRLFKFRARKDNSVTPSSCAKTCLGHNMNYAGVQFKNECWCSKTPPPSSARTNENECSTVCNADIRLTCGGPNRLNIYFNYGKREKLLKEFGHKVFPFNEHLLQRD